MDPLIWASLALVIFFFIWALLDKLNYNWARKLREFIDDVMKSLFSPFTG